MEAPHNPVAESAFLGACLLDPTIIDNLEIQLVPSDFYEPKNASIWKVIETLHGSGQMIDYLTVTAELHATNQQVPMDYVASLPEKVATAVHAGAYAKIIHDLGTRRRIFSAACRIGQIAYDQQLDLNEEAKPKIEDIFLDVIADKNASGPQTLGDLTDLHWNSIERELGGEITGLKFGFSNGVDQAIRGLRHKQLAILAGRPGAGKTTLARQIATHVAMTQKPAAIFSLETPAEEHIRAFPLMLGHVSERPTYTAEELHRIMRAKDVMKQLPLYIDDSSPLSVNTLRTKVIQLQRREKDLGLIVVDYLQLMDGAKQNDDSLDVTPISRGLKQLTMATGIPILALSAMNRSIEARGDDAEPQLSDLRWGGEADADIVLFVHRKRVPTQQARAVMQTAVVPVNLYIKKNRNGPGDAKFLLDFFASQKRFEEAHEVT